MHNRCCPEGVAPRHKVNSGSGQKPKSSERANVVRFAPKADLLSARFNDRRPGSGSLRDRIAFRRRSRWHKPLLPPPAFRKCRHRGLARRLVAVRRYVGNSCVGRIQLPDVSNDDRPENLLDYLIVQVEIP